VLGLLSPLGVSKEELYWIVGMDHMSWGSWWESSNRSGSKIWVGKGAGYSTAMIFTAILSTLTMVSLNDHLFDIMVAHDFSFFLLKKQWFVLEFFFFFLIVSEAIYGVAYTPRFVEFFISFSFLFYYGWWRKDTNNFDVRIANTPNNKCERVFTELSLQMSFGQFANLIKQMNLI